MCFNGEGCERSSRKVEGRGRGMEGMGKKRGEGKAENRKKGGGIDKRGEREGEGKETYKKEGEQ